jgi:hypothetical protein
MPTLVLVSSRASWRATSRAVAAVLAAAVLAAGCSTVDLGPRYDPPPVRMPQSAAPAPGPAPLPPVATAQPVAPGRPVGQPLPPLGSAASGQPPVGSTAPGQPPVTAPLPQTAPPSASPESHLFTLTTRLEGAAVQPPTRSVATGQLDALYDAGARLLRWKASWSGLSGAITGVQFHGPAGMDQNGPPAMVWPGPFGPTYEGRATLTPQQAEDLLEGRWYVNVFTSAFPAGEVRGQLRVVR